jgi:hypothetical protein
VERSLYRIFLSENMFSVSFEIAVRRCRSLRSVRIVERSLYRKISSEFPLCEQNTKYNVVLLSFGNYTLDLLCEVHKRWIMCFELVLECITEESVLFPIKSPFILLY